MKGVLRWFVLPAIIIFYVENFSQEISTEWLQLDEDLIYNIVLVTDNNNIVTKGLLQGIKGDTLFLFSDNKITGIYLMNISTLIIYNERIKNTAFTLGTLSGAYLGSILFLTSQDNPAYFAQYGVGELFIYELGFITVGGAIGYAIDHSGGNGEEVFNFKNGYDSEIKRLKEFLTGSEGEKKFHLNLSIGSVSTTPMRTAGYRFQSSINAYRMITATYKVSNLLTLGGGIANFGEPFRQHEFYSSTFTRTGTFKYNGLGYYLIIMMPLHFSEVTELNLTGGIGIGKINMNYHELTTNGPDNKINDININKNVFSSLIAGALCFYITQKTTISAQLDYIYIPEKMPRMEIFEKQNLYGNFSFGLGMGFHF